MNKKYKENKYSNNKNEEENNNQGGMSDYNLNLIKTDYRKIQMLAMGTFFIDVSLSSRK